MADTLKVEYFGTNVGKIYFTDIDKRGQLGGSVEGNYRSGQDEYIIWGETKVLLLTDDVLYSMSKGVLKYFSTEASSTIFSTNHGVPLTLTEGAYGPTDEYPRQDIGDGDTGFDIACTGCMAGLTCGSRFCDAYMEILGRNKYSTGHVYPYTGVGIPGDTGVYHGGDL